MSNIMPKWALYASVAAVAVGAIIGNLERAETNVPTTPIAPALSATTPTNSTGNNSTDFTNSTSDSTGSNGTSVTSGPTPSVTPYPIHLTVADTSLPSTTVQSDSSYLETLFKQHPGDDIVRGPDDLVYNIDYRLNPDTQEYTGHLDVHFHNNLGHDLSKVYFNVWPNALHYQNTGGWQTVTHVTAGPTEEQFTLKASVLTITLDQPIQDGKDGQLSLDFEGKLPEINDRYGYQGTTMDLGNWYPIMAVHDQYGWVTPPYYPDGESFYSLTGCYHVNMTLPKDAVLAGSGVETKTTPNSDGTVTHTYEMRAVRDVAFVADANYKVMTAKVGHTTVYTYYRPDESNQGQEAPVMSKAASDAIASYSKQYGQYPYSTLRVCAMEGWFGGMEYPGLVMISFPSDRGSSDRATTIDTAHEVGHQWFYGMIGDDEYLTPFMDESFTSFAEMRFNNRLADAANVQYAGRPSYSVRSFPNSDYSKEQSTYFATVYLGGTNAIETLHQKLGDAKFDTLMNTYFKQYQYRVATIGDFMELASKVAGTDLTDFFHNEMHVFSTDDKDAPTEDWVQQAIKADGRDWAGDY